MQWMVSPTGISAMGRALPGRISAPEPVIMAWPALSPTGARI
jgi:hypothetical protein